MTTYTFVAPFGGIGGGALGFLQARAALGDRRARFVCLGGLDSDPLACEDFARLTGAVSDCLDVTQLSPQWLRARYGEAAPDVVFASPPCKGASALLGKARARLPKYREMNELALVWTRLMLAAWPTPPRIVLIENVPRLPRRAGDMVGTLRSLLRGAGYVLHEAYHECGELGGLAQIRRRWLLVARRADSVSALLYQPPRQRVRAVGELLESLPLPEQSAGGRLHKLIRMSWRNWIRLALIPAGGDWRDLPGVVPQGARRREVHRRHHVDGEWCRPSATVAGPGSNGPRNIADPRLPPSGRPYRHCHRVVPWSAAANTVTGASRTNCGAQSVADPRLPGLALPHRPTRHWAKYRVTPWSQPSGAVTGANRPGSGSPTVADPRLPTDPTLATAAYDHAYGVLAWLAPSYTVHGQSHPGCGTYAVADVRVDEVAPGARYFGGTYGVLSWEAPGATVTANARPHTGRWCLADPRLPESEQPAAVRYLDDLDERPQNPPVIVSSDGTWHRPFTVLELCVIQGFPWSWGGAALDLAGSVTSVRSRVGNAVPPPTARAMAEQMLLTLLCSDHHVMRLSADGVWVEPDDDRPLVYGAPPVLDA